MGYKLKIDVDAFNDVIQARDWYELQSKGLGNRYKKQVKQQINSLKENPYLFAIKYKEIHCRKIEKFPFLIHYKINDELKTVYVYAIFHTSRNPEIWKRIEK